MTQIAAPTIAGTCPPFVQSLDHFTVAFFQIAEYRVLVTYSCTPLLKVALYVSHYLKKFISLADGKECLKK